RQQQIKILAKHPSLLSPMNITRSLARSDEEFSLKRPAYLGKSLSASVVACVTGMVRGRRAWFRRLWSGSWRLVRLSFRKCRLLANNGHQGVANRACLVF